MKHAQTDGRGDLRCYHCGSRQFAVKRRASRLTRGIFVCQSCGRKNLTGGQPQPFEEPARAPAPLPAGPPPAWVPDPFGRYEVRWWDGTRWTEHVATGGERGVDAPH
jgi:hypothetical protein